MVSHLPAMTRNSVASHECILASTIPRPQSPSCFDHIKSWEWKSENVGLVLVLELQSDRS